MKQRIFLSLFMFLTVTPANSGIEKKFLALDEWVSWGDSSDEERYIQNLEEEKKFLTLDDNKKLAPESITLKPSEFKTIVPKKNSKIIHLSQIHTSQKSFENNPSTLYHSISNTNSAHSI